MGRLPTNLRARIPTHRVSAVSVNQRVSPLALNVKVTRNAVVISAGRSVTTATLSSESSSTYRTWRGAALCVWDGAWDQWRPQDKIRSWLRA